MQNNIVGKGVRKARNLHIPKLTQEELAAKLQLLGWRINRGGVAKIESGVRQVTDKEILLLSEAVDVSIMYLFDISDQVLK